MSKTPEDIISRTAGLLQESICATGSPERAAAGFSASAREQITVIWRAHCAHTETSVPKETVAELTARMAEIAHASPPDDGWDEFPTPPANVYG